ncbi:Hemopexin-like domain-containing protein [Chaetomium sp. MPI-CAGE-AT-0009]|nr:Hemopexin-like domain-containing protein [Chaetomium sp. MPI-CAGE-AT-0009]
MESYFFTGAYYARVMAAPPTQPGCVTFGPARPVHDWPSLVTVGFDSVDATLPVPGSDDEIYVFSGLRYAIIKVVSPEDNRVVYGPAKITDYWRSLAKAGFDRVDSCMRVPGKEREYQAYFFRGEKYVRVWQKQELGSIVDGPKRIADHWPGLVEAGFDVVDAILPVFGGDGLAYFFRGNRHVRIKIDKDDPN